MMGYGIIATKWLLYLRIPVSAQAAEIRALNISCSENMIE